MPFPTSFPSAQLQLLAEAVMPNHDQHKGREYLEAAYDVEGYALSQLLPETPAPRAKVMECLECDDDECPDSPEEQSKLLKEAAASSPDESGGRKRAAAPAKAIPWAAILAIVMQILQQYIK